VWVQLFKKVDSPYKARLTNTNNTMASIQSLVTKLQQASNAYHNGLPLLMTDEQYDAGIDQLRALDPSNRFLQAVGAPIPPHLKCQEVELPIPLPSLNKLKSSEEIAKWLGTLPSSCQQFQVSVKLDGCSALWFPNTGKLYTRGNGLKGRDISKFAPFITGCVSGRGITAVRGELIMRLDSPAIPSGKIARNIVAGFLNRPTPDKEALSHVQFVAYEHCSNNGTPTTDYALLEANRFAVADNRILRRSEITPALLTATLDSLEAACVFPLDGIVVAPDMKRPAGWVPEVRRNLADSEKDEAVNPSDRMAWKTRGIAQTAITTVTAVEWNISTHGYLIPRVLFTPVSLSGATIGAAAGLHGRWIYENGVGPGAQIQIRRSGDVIPQIIAVLTVAPGGPAMPAFFKWADEEGDTVSTLESTEEDGVAAASSAVHIKPAGAEYVAELACRRLTRALKELGAENVGPGIVAKLYSGGLTDICSIYKASVADLQTLDGIQKRGAERIWAGLRVKQNTWNELNFLVASCTMPRGVGHTKLAPLLAVQPNPALWPTSSLSRLAGISENTIGLILAAIPAYLEWKTASGLVCVPVAIQNSTVAAAEPMTVVFTGVRDKGMEARLTAQGHTVAPSVTKKTTHVVHADGADTDTVKIKKARETGARILSLSEMASLF